MKKELKHKVKRKEKEKEEVMGRCSGCGESLLQLKGRMMHRSFSISIATRTPALSRQSPLIKLPILPPYNEIEHRGVAKCVCLLLHTHTHTQRHTDIAIATLTVLPRRRGSNVAACPWR